MKQNFSKAISAIQILLVAFLLAFVSCSDDGEKSEGSTLWYSYAPVDVRDTCVVDSPVVMRLACDKEPGKKAKKGEAKDSIKEEKDSIRCIYNENFEGIPLPVEIKKTDESGEWGYVNFKPLFSKRCKGWVQLKDMIFCDDTKTDTAMPARMVTADKLEVFKHPGDEHDINKLLKGEKVLVYASVPGWNFISWITYIGGTRYTRYGWVKSASLAKIGHITSKELTANADSIRYEKVLAKEKAHGKVQRWAVKHSMWIQSILSRAFKYTSIFGAFCAVLLIIPAVIRRKFLGPPALFIFSVVTLFIASVNGAGAFSYGAGIALMSYILFYPMLYTPLSRFALPCCCLVGFVFVTYELIIFELLGGGSWLWNVVWFFIDICIIIGALGYILIRADHYLCPNCGYYAHHPKTSETIVDSEEFGYVEGTDYHIVNQGGTNYAIREDYKSVKTKETLKVKRQCRKCKRIFDYNIERETWYKKRW